MAGARKMVLMSRKGLTNLIGMLEEIDAEERKRKHPGTFDYHVHKVTSLNFASRESHEAHAAA